MAIEWNETRETIDFYRDGSDPAKFDTEYSIEYTLRYRVSNDDAEAEVDGPFEVTYWADANASGVVIPWNELRPETREKFESAIKGQAKYNAREASGINARPYWSPFDDDADSAYECARDSE